MIVGSHYTVLHSIIYLLNLSNLQATWFLLAGTAGDAAEDWRQRLMEQLGQTPTLDVSKGILWPQTLSWVSEPSCEILVFMWSLGPLGSVAERVSFWLPLCGSWLVDEDLKNGPLFLLLCTGAFVLGNPIEALHTWYMSHGQNSF